SAPLHDLGKIGIPDRILLKPGRLTPDEWVTMKTHATIGSTAIIAAERLLGTSSTFLRYAREIAHSHQEKWDGSGYPDGTSEEQIPLRARLMALADVYDALISRRVYKPPFPHRQAVEMIFEGRGSHFDPAMVDAFIEITEEFRVIAGAFQDPDEDPGAPPAA